MSGDSPGWLKPLQQAFRQHPFATLILLVMAGMGWLANQHQEVRAALMAMMASSFSAVPSGWMVLLLAGMGWRVSVLSREVKNCHDERQQDRRTWEGERAALNEKVETSHDMVSKIFARAVEGRDQDRRQEQIPVEVERRKPPKRRRAPRKP